MIRMSEVLIIGSAGLGDTLISFQAASIAQDKGEVVTVGLSVRDEIYQPLKRIFSDDFIIDKLDESLSYNNSILKQPAPAYLISRFNRIYYVLPDLLFNNKYSFNFQLYNTSPQEIRSIRLLTGKRKNRSKAVYLGMLSSTPGYTYQNVPRLAVELARRLPDYHFYLPVLDKWAETDLQKWEFKEKPDNLYVPYWDLTTALEFIGNCSYFVGTDNGPSHIAYHYGIPRLLLDPQFGKLPWIARWREDYTESIPITTSIQDIIDLVKLNLTVPQTTLIPRVEALKNLYGNWQQLLFLKDS